MISLEAPCKSLKYLPYREGEGFYVDGKDQYDCFNQIHEWSKKHPEKWIYYFHVGMKPGYPVPVGRYIIEVIYFDEQPDLFMPFWSLFKKGEEK